MLTPTFSCGTLIRLKPGLTPEITQQLPSLPSTRKPICSHSPSICSTPLAAALTKALTVLLFDFYIIHEYVLLKNREFSQSDQLSREIWKSSLKTTLFALQGVFPSQRRLENSLSLQEWEIGLHGSFTPSPVFNTQK